MSRRPYPVGSPAMIRPLSAVAALAAILALAACGGSSELSKSELVSQADTICKKTSDKLDKIPPPRKQSDLSAYGQKASSAIADGTGQLRELKPPKAQQDDYDTFVSAAERQQKLASDLSEVSKDKDRSKIKKVLTDAQKADQEGKAAAKRIGLKECGKS